MSSVGQLVPQITSSLPNTTLIFNGPHIEGTFCSSVDYNYDPIAAIICSIYIIFGITYTLFGYRLFKGSMFLTGFTFGSLIVYLICLQEYLMPSYGNVFLTILGTCVYGGAVIATSLDYFFEHLMMLKWLWERAKLEPPVIPPCRLSWLALAAWPAAAIVGLTAQCALTGIGIHHEESISAQKRRIKAQQPRPQTREQRAEMKQRKYRYLYQVRTAHGDVISQSYVQALQKKTQGNNWSGAASGGGECSTLQSDSTHLTVLAGYDHTAPTDSDDDNQIRPEP